MRYISVITMLGSIIQTYGVILSDDEWNDFKIKLWSTYLLDEDKKITLDNFIYRYYSNIRGYMIESHKGYYSENISAEDYEYQKMDENNFKFSELSQLEIYIIREEYKITIEKMIEHIVSKHTNCRKYEDIINDYDMKYTINGIDFEYINLSHLEDEYTSPLDGSHFFGITVSNTKLVYGSLSRESVLQNCKIKNGMYSLDLERITNSELISLGINCDAIMYYNFPDRM